MRGSGRGRWYPRARDGAGRCRPQRGARLRRTDPAGTQGWRHLAGCRRARRGHGHQRRSRTPPTTRPSPAPGRCVPWSYGRAAIVCGHPGRRPGHRPGRQRAPHPPTPPRPPRRAARRLVPRVRSPGPPARSGCRPGPRNPRWPAGRSGAGRREQVRRRAGGVRPETVRHPETRRGCRPGVPSPGRLPGNASRSSFSCRWERGGAERPAPACARPGRAPVPRPVPRLRPGARPARPVCAPGPVPRPGGPRPAPVRRTPGPQPPPGGTAGCPGTIPRPRRARFPAPARIPAQVR